MRLRPFLEFIRRWRPAGSVPPVPPPRAEPPPPPRPAVDAYARSSLEKAERKLEELDWRLHAVEAERDTHARSRSQGRPS